MYPLSEDALALHEVARHWAGDLRQRPPMEEVFTRLVSSIWRGELEVICPPGRKEVRRHLLEALVRIPDHQGVAIFPDAGSVPDRVKEQPDGSALVDTRTFVILPEAQSDWDTAVIEAACAELAQVDPEAYALSFRVVLRMQTVSRAAFELYCTEKHYVLPPFWFGPRHQQAATAKARRDCQNWLESLAKAGPKPGAKADLWREAKRRFPRLTRHAFDDIWDGAVPPGWRGAGAPKGPRTPV